MVKFDAQAIVGWGTFISIYSLLWNFSVGHMMRQASPVALHNRLRRSSLLLVGGYTACRATLLLALYMVLLFCLMGVVQCVLPFLKHLPRLHAVLSWLCSERVLFHAVSVRLLPLHAAVLASSLTIATVYATVYVRDPDLLDPNLWTSVVVRDALCMAMPGLLAYCGYCLLTCTLTPP